MFQRKYLIFLGSLAALALLWCAGWFWIASSFQTEIANFAEQRRSEGVILEWDRVDITGFPVRFSTRFVRPRGSWTSPERTLMWTADDDPVVRPFANGPGFLMVDAKGTHRFRIVEPDGTFNLTMRSERFDGDIAFDDDNRASAARGVIEPLFATFEDQPEFRLSRVSFDWARELGRSDTDALHPAGNELTFALILDDADLSPLPLDPAVRDTLGARIERAAAQVRLRGDLDLTFASAERLAQWRDAGGTMDIEQVQLHWGPLRIAGEGTVALDASLQPEGAFTARIAGLDKLIDVLEARGRVRPQQAAIARIALAVLTRAPSDGGPPEARVPVTVQNRVLSIGPVPLLTLDPIEWN